MSILIKHFTFNYTSQFAHGDTLSSHGLPDCYIRTAFLCGEIRVSENDSYMKNSVFFFDLINGKLFSKREYL